MSCSIGEFLANEVKWWEAEEIVHVRVRPNGKQHVPLRQDLIHYAVPSHPCQLQLFERILLLRGVRLLDGDDVNLAKRTLPSIADNL